MLEMIAVFASETLDSIPSRIGSIFRRSMLSTTGFVTVTVTVICFDTASCLFGVFPLVSVVAMISVKWCTPTLGGPGTGKIGSISPRCVQRPPTAAYCEPEDVSGVIVEGGAAAG